jgi:tyrosine-protein phosphatase SIW14
MTLLKVRDGLYRGSRPEGEADFQLIAKMGFQTVLNLEDRMNIVKTEIACLKVLNILEVSVPMGEILPPDISHLKYTSLLLSKCSTDHLIFVHCLHGVDRTGAVILADRVANCEWDFDKAYQEMLDMGHHVFFYWWWKSRLKNFAIKYAKS